jgi:cyclophilin family peptidyl-prolyl cis-trans isomerase
MTPMNYRHCVAGLLVLLSWSGLTAPVIDPIGDVTIPAGKSLIVPITATSPTGQPLTYKVTSSTNGIAVVMHTNNPFWQLSVAQAASTNDPGAFQTPFRGGLVTVTNVGSMTFMLFPEYAPHAVNVFQGLTTAGFYNSNTIFHRVITNFMIQGGDANTNGSGRLVFEYDNDFDAQALFTGSGQLAVANHGKDTDGGQFFITLGPQRHLDFGYTLFGQMVRGFDVLTNLISTVVDTNNRPLADEVIQTASYVPNTTDTVLTLTATNVAGMSGRITVIADDGVGGRATNTFAVTLVTDTNSNYQPFISSNVLTNMVGPANKTLTNWISATELGGSKLFWGPAGLTAADAARLSKSSFSLFTNVLRTLTYNVRNENGRLQLFVVPPSGYTGPISAVFDVSTVDPSYWSYYEALGWTLPIDEQVYTFVFGDTPISGQSKTVSVVASMPFANVVLASFTNGVAASSSQNFSAFINWGDNSTNSGMVTANPAGEKAVLGSHTYTCPGTYPVYVQIQSTVGASATVLSYVNVTDPAAALTSVMSVQVTGQGTVFPDYDNASLTVGGSYSLTATPAHLWSLATWTDQNGFVLGTGTNLNFTMYPGLKLTATFVLAVAPSVAIASPVNGKVITNLYSAPAVVAGTATNNAPITNIWFQVNSGGWQPASGTTSWTASFIPAYGITNRIQAYAVNNYGYTSPTSSVFVLYLAGDILTVNTTGSGTFTPKLNGQVLPLGSNYVLKAAPAAGCALVNWTDGGGNIVTNGASLRFRMTSNLTFTANFVDTNKPTLSIVTPTANQRWSNAVFTVTGKASDNLRVTNVLTSINGSDWTAATTVNNWTNWTSSVSLAPGTNTLQAYAVDASGNASATSTVRLIYVLSAPLVVTTNGNGTVTPNYNGAVLQLGVKYSMTAKAATGFRCTGWTGSQTTNAATLSFVMASNLMFTANFVDTNRPTLTIVSPTANQRWSNSVFTVTGKASDNVRVASVLTSLNGLDWTAANTANNWSNWTSVISLTPGTNTLQAYAVDAAGNASVTNAVKFIYVLSAPLVVSTNGNGTVTPNYNGALLQIGSSNTMTANPGAGYLFSNWVGSVLGTTVLSSSSPKLTFGMQSNLVLQANFVPSPFIPLAGNYYGLVYDETNGIAQASAGFFSGTLGSAGAFSAKLLMSGRTNSLAGQFDLTGHLAAAVPQTGGGALALDLQLGTDTLTGTVSNGAWVSALDAYRAVFSAATNPCPYAGRYTMVLPGEEDGPGCPDGSGYASLAVDKGGSAVLLGALAEGTVLSQSAPVSKEGDWPLYAPLYGTNGSMIAWLRLTLPAGLTNTLAVWTKPTNSLAKYYPGGFTNVSQIIGSSYVFSTTNRVLALTNAVVTFSGANLPAPITNQLLLTATNRFVNQTPYPMALMLNTTNGVVSGWFKLPGIAKTNVFGGVLLQEQNRAEGYFLGTNASGRFQLEGAP